MSDSIRKIQEAYVSLALSHFVDERREYVESGSVREPPRLIVPAGGGMRDLLETKVWSFIEEIRDFWAQNFGVLQEQLESADGLRVGIWGDKVGIHRTTEGISIGKCNGEPFPKVRGAPG